MWLVEVCQRAWGKMDGTWLLALSLLVDFSTVTPQPITTDCCPCDATEAGPRTRSRDDFPSDCPCPPRPRAEDAEAAASILMPALRAMQPFVTQPDQKTEPKPLLQPEVGLASSVLETLRQATDEEYHEALVRDAARSAVTIIESTLDPPDDGPIETPKNKLRIYLNTQGDDMDDNLPEPSHIQETRCIHSPLQSIHRTGPLRTSRPTPIIEIIDLPRQPKTKSKNKNIMHRNFFDMDNGIGASNIQERVMQPNFNDNMEIRHLESKPPMGVLKQNKLGEKGDDGFDLNKKIKPNLHLKLKELIDNLEKKSKIENWRIPEIDLKKYISTSTLMPPLRMFNPVEKSIYNNRPLLLKDLLKLKDVELIPRTLTKNNSNEKSYPKLKLQSDLNPVIDNCKEDSSNLMPLITKTDTSTTVNPIDLDITDIETSPTNSNPLFQSISNEVDKSPKQSSIPGECLASSEYITDVISSTSVPTDLKSQDYFDYNELKVEGDPNNCKRPSGNSDSQPIAQTIDPPNEGWNNKDSRKEQDMTFESNEDIIDESSDDETFQIELLEDLDTPIIFDNDSFNSESNLERNDNVQDTLTNNKNILEDPVAEPSNNNMQTENQINQDPNISTWNIKKTVGDCNSPDSFTTNSHEILVSQNFVEKDQESIEENNSEDNINIAIKSAHDSFSDINQDSRHVTFKDLQNMSNSILSLSECEPPKDTNTKSYLVNNIQQNTNDNDISNSASSAPISETTFKHIEDSSAIKTSLSTSNQPNKISGINSDEISCESLTSNETAPNENEANVKINNVDPGIDNNEMRAEASETQSKLYHPKNLLVPSIADSKKNIMNFTKATSDISHIAKLDKHHNFLENLKFKLADLFSTTEKAMTSAVGKNPGDNGFESSNTKPMVVKLDKFQDLLKTQRTPNKLLRESLPVKLPAISLKPLHLPNHVNQPEAKKLQNLLFPLELSRPFEDALDPSLHFGALSDKLRSHTENSIQSVKDTLESTFKDAQNFRLSSPTDPIDTHDVLESISNRRDEMREKLEAIHSDFNDRFSSFQQSVLDHFNVPQGENSGLLDSSRGGGLRASYIPIRKDVTLPGTLKLQSVKHEQDFIPHRINVPKQRKNSEISLTSSKVPTLSDSARLRNSERKHSLQTPVLYSTTPIPSFVPRPKVLKTKVDSIPKLTTETRSKTKPFKVPTLSQDNLTEIKPLSLKSRWTSNLSDEPHTSPSSSSRNNLPVKSAKEHIKNINDEDSPVNKFKKTLTELGQNKKHRNDLIKSHRNLERGNSLNKQGHSGNQESLLSRMKIGRPRTGSRINDELIVSPTSHMDTIHPSQDETSLRLVEPLKENVPYKCKLICYKDS